MVFEDKPGHHLVIDLSTVVQKDKAQRFIEKFQGTKTSGRILNARRWKSKRSLCLKSE